MATIGILGGGQLALMMAQAGRALGFDFIVVDPSADACASEAAPLVQAGLSDFESLARFAERVDFVTFEFENVPVATVEFLSSRIKVAPGATSLAVAQDRLEEKTLFRALGMATPEFATVDSMDDLTRGVEQLGLPAILKTRRLGYDGKGQFKIRSRDDVAGAWAALGGSPLLLEAFVPFEREASLIAVRDWGGAFLHYPLTQNWHVDGILSASLAPSPGAYALEKEAAELVRKLANRLDYVGVIAVEFFIRGGRLLANEMAPRVHNSGHWTIEGAETSQFENHLRAIAGLPLGSTSLTSTSVMLNWIGRIPANIPSEPLAVLHDYRKLPRERRKVGHTTISGSKADVRDALVRFASTIGRDDQAAPVLQALD